jgi:hypothetical protein
MPYDQDHFKWLNPPLLTAGGPFEQALVEVGEPGTHPRSNPGRWCWGKEARHP